MKAIKAFFADFPRNIKKGEKGSTLFILLMSILVVACLFLVVIFVPRMFSANAANAGEDVTLTSEESLRFDYTLVTEPAEETTTEESSVSETETSTEAVIPSDLNEILKTPIEYEVGKENDPEDGQRPTVNESDPPPVIIEPIEPPVDNGSGSGSNDGSGGGSSDGSGGGSGDGSTNVPVQSPYHYFATQAMNGFQVLDGVKYYFQNGATYNSGFHKLGGLRYQINNHGAISSKMGIDVSVFNGTINWQVAKNYGIDYAILRIGYRGWGSSGSLNLDAKFKENARNAISSGMPIGVYFFSQAVNAEEGVQEASKCIQWLKEFDIPIQYPIYIDSELSTARAEAGKDGRADNISKAARTAAVKAFCDTVRNAGYRAGVYANTSWFQTELEFSQLSSYEIWVASWNISQPALNGNWQMWQFSGDSGETVNIPGLQPNGLKIVDMNLSVRDYAGGADMSRWGENNILLSTQSDVDAYVAAEQAVAQAESSCRQVDYNSAAAKVNALFQTKAKNAMLDRLKRIQVVA